MAKLDSGEKAWILTWLAAIFMVCTTMGGCCVSEIEKTRIETEARTQQANIVRSVLDPAAAAKREEASDGRD